ncbi:MAG: hypothetical protein AAFZ07_11210 [Actinomycetota bacterium]
MRLLEAPDDTAAVEQLHDLGCTDGLPVVVPTPDRVDRFVLASGLDADALLGVMGPLGGAATVEQVAANAVMAGCLPDHLPVVLAAVRAVCRPEFDLAEMQSTTHCTAPLVIVHGPVVDFAGVASGFGALGPGHRANATIGRALRLCMMNLGGARPGVSDMALLGHPGKFTFCLGESAELSPWDPMHTDWGYRADESAVTVVGAEPPHSTIFVGDADDPTSVDRLLDALARVIANTGSNNAHFRAGAITVVLNPDHATVLDAAGLSRADVRRELAARATNPRGELARLNPAFAGEGHPSDRIPAVRDAADLLVLVAGGPGLYSVVMPSWGTGPHRNPAVHERVDLDQACEVPGAPYMPQ